MRKSKSVRNAILGLAVTLLTAGWATADTVAISATVNGAPNPSQIVVIHYTGSLGGENFSNYSGAGYAGQINWNNATGTDLTPGGTLLASMPGSFTSTGTFSTYCIDITQDIGIGGTYPFTGLTENLSDTPVVLDPTYHGMGATDATAIENLYYNEYNVVTAGGHAIQYDGSGDTDSSSNDQSAAFQIAIWDIIYGTPGTSVTSSSNSFWVDNSYNSFSSFNEVTGMANRFAAAALAGPAESFADPILALTTPLYQDQLVVGVPNPSGGPIVPTPGGAAAGLVLLGGLALRQRLRSVR